MPAVLNIYNILIAAAAWFTLRFTPFGRQVYAVGDNLEAIFAEDGYTVPQAATDVGFFGVPGTDPARPGATILGPPLKPAKK